MRVGRADRRSVGPLALSQGMAAATRLCVATMMLAGGLVLVGRDPLAPEVGAQPMSGGGALRVVAEHGGIGRGVAVDEAHVYVALGSRLEVYPLGFAEGQAAIGGSEPGPWEVRALAATGDGYVVAVLLSGGDRLDLGIFDVRDPSRPALVAREQRRDWPYEEEALVAAAPGRAWLAFGRSIVAVDLSDPTRPRVLGARTFDPSPGFSTGRWRAIDHHEGRVLAVLGFGGGVPSTPGPGPTACPGGPGSPGCPTPRAHRTIEHRIFALEGRGEGGGGGAEGDEAGLRVTDVEDIAWGVEGIAVGGGRAAVLDNGTLELWRLDDGGALRSEEAPRPEWVSIGEALMALGERHLWAVSFDRWPMLLTRQADGTWTQRAASERLVARQDRRAPARAVVAPDGSLVVAPWQEEVARVVAVEDGRPPAPVRAPAATCYRKVTADAQGAWTLTGGQGSKSQLWRLPRSGPPVYAATLASPSAGVSWAPMGESLLLADGEALRLWSLDPETGQPGSEDVTVASGGMSPGPSPRLLEAAGSYVLLERDTIRMVAHLESGTLSGHSWIAPSLAPSPISLDGDVVWTVGSVDGGLRLHGGRLAARPRWVPVAPGLPLTVAPSLIAAEKGRLLLVLGDGSGVRVELVTWTDLARPRGRGGLQVFSQPTQPAIAAALDGSLAWVALIDGGFALHLAAVDLSVPDALDLPPSLHLASGPVFASELSLSSVGGRAFVVVAQDCILREVERTRDATPDRPTRPPPRPTASPSPTLRPSPTLWPSPTPTRVRLALPLAWKGDPSVSDR